MHETQAPPKAILFDFDGTLSTLRSGWEQVMRPLMLETVSPQNPRDPALGALVDAYIDASTGIQTIHQMRWLAEQVTARGGRPLDPWAYKAQYNERLMRRVALRIESVAQGRAVPDAYLIRGSVALLDALRARGVALYVASGTDDADVKREAEVLGVSGYFEQIVGAPHRRADCGKEAVLSTLLGEKGLSGRSLAVIGDGKVEIGLGHAVGARTLGVASNEEVRAGINPVKEARLQAAGADRIVGDFQDVPSILAWMGWADAKEATQ